MVQIEPPKPMILIQILSDISRLKSLKFALSKDLCHSQLTTSELYFVMRKCKWDNQKHL